MRIEPHLDEIVNGERGMRRGISVAFEHECLVSAVTLIFAAIDALSALSRPVDQLDTTSDVFVRWCEQYICPSRSLNCSAHDLYAARCGVLHTYSADSKLQRKGGARRLIYEWESGPEAGIAAALPAEALVIGVNKLREAFENGVHEFLIDSEMNPPLRERVYAHLPSLLCYTPWPPTARSSGVTRMVEG